MEGRPFQELGQLAGLSRQRVNQALKRLEQAGLLRVEYGGVTVLSLDGLTLNTIDLAETVNPEGRGPRNPFHQPFYLLLNLAIGGNQGGDPSQTAFPSRYEIDYVRVYQKAPAQ